jgi:hypothetical protein
MAERAQKGQETRTVSFRMPRDMYTDMVAVAELRGVDLSGMLNWMCAEFRPRLLKQKAEYEAALLDAASLRDRLASAGKTGDALSVLRDLLEQLQEMYAAMMKQSLDDDRRLAG